MKKQKAVGPHSSNESGNGDKNESDEEGVTANIIDSPGGSHHLYQPVVPKDFMPDTNVSYNSLDEAAAFLAEGLDDYAPLPYAAFLAAAILVRGWTFLPLVSLLRFRLLLSSLQVGAGFGVWLPLLLSRSSCWACWVVPYFRLSSFGWFLLVSVVLGLSVLSFFGVLLYVSDLTC
ncbi:hypothetical protein LXL04_028395 [Taraxacum kok-saghyz]